MRGGLERNEVRPGLSLRDTQARCVCVHVCTLAYVHVRVGAHVHVCRLEVGGSPDKGNTQG